MTKTFVDELISNMKRAGIVTKASPWSFEGFGETQKNVRFVGLRLSDDWLDVFSERDNILLKFITDRSSAYVEFYIANSTPFIKIITRNFTGHDKWETLLGDIKRILKKDKSEFIHHTDSIGNLYAKMKPALK